MTEFRLKPVGVFIGGAAHADDTQFTPLPMIVFTGPCLHAAQWVKNKSNQNGLQIRNRSGKKRS
jgi:hypothetical protein